MGLGGDGRPSSQSEGEAAAGEWGGSPTVTEPVLSLDCQADCVVGEEGLTGACCHLGMESEAGAVSRGEAVQALAGMGRSVRYM